MILAGWNYKMVVYLVMPYDILESYIRQRRSTYVLENEDNPDMCNMNLVEMRTFR